MSRAAILTVTGLVAAIAATGLAWSAAAALQQEEPEVRRGQSVTICHATGNGKYVQNSPGRRQHRQRQGSRRPPRGHHPAVQIRAVGPGRGRLVSRPELGRGRTGDLGQRLRSSRPTRSAGSAGLQPGKRLGDQGSVHPARDRRDDRGGLPAGQVRRVQGRAFGRRIRRLERVRRERLVGVVRTGPGLGRCECLPRRSRVPHRGSGPVVHQVGHLPLPDDRESAGAPRARGEGRS